MGTFPSSSVAFSGSACSYPDISRNWLYDSTWKMRYRTSFDSNGYGVHPSVTSFTMHAETHQQAGRVLRDLNWLSTNFYPGSSPQTISWIGVGGAKVCKPGYHRYGAALDFTRFHWASNFTLDLNVHGRSGSLGMRRRYLAMLAMCRRHFGTVLHTHNDPDGTHRNHVHVDRGHTAVPLNKNVKTDATIVQWAARDIGGISNMAIDGIWGNQTQAGWLHLRDKFKLLTSAGGCIYVNPFEGGEGKNQFLNLIGMHGMANKSAGYFTTCDL